MKKKVYVYEIYDSVYNLVFIYDVLQSLVWKTVHYSVYDSVLCAVRNPVSDAVESVMQNEVTKQSKNTNVLIGLL